MPDSSKCTVHFRWSFIFSTYSLYFLPGRNFAPLEEVKVPLSKSAEFFPKSGPWGILQDLGWFGLNCTYSLKFTIVTNRTEFPTWHGIRVHVKAKHSDWKLLAHYAEPTGICDPLWEKVIYVTKIKNLVVYNGWKAHNISFNLVYGRAL